MEKYGAQTEEHLLADYLQDKIMSPVATISRRTLVKIIVDIKGGIDGASAERLINSLAQRGAITPVEPDSNFFKICRKRYYR